MTTTLNRPIDVTWIGRGFADPVFQSQAAFRVLMDAAARPGRPLRLAADVDTPTGLPIAAAVALLTLADYETPLMLPPDLAFGPAGDYLRFHAGAPLVEAPAGASFAVIRALDVARVLPGLPIGEDRYPDRSATAFVLCEALEGGTPLRLTGPGIETSTAFAPKGIDGAGLAALVENARNYPLGVDVFFVADDEIAGLPRSTAITVEG